MVVSRPKPPTYRWVGKRPLQVVSVCAGPMANGSRFRVGVDDRGVIE
jgi:hypothetical protein